MAIGVGLWLSGLVGCSGGMHAPIPYAGGRPYGDDGEDTDAPFDVDPLPDGEDTGAPPPPSPPDHAGDCCVGNGTPGCDNKPIELCVCASDPWCCDETWDDACAALIESSGCGHCSGGGEPPPPPPPDGASGGDCCAAHAEPGCDDPDIEACVCAVESFCCDTQWSAACLAVAEVHGCGTCGEEPPPAGDDGGGVPPPPPPGGDDGGGVPPPEPPGPEAGDCCTVVAGATGCTDAGIEACVCAQDDYCCTTEWDAICVDEVDSLGCGSCGGGTTGGGGGISVCCEQQAGPGCPDAAVEACVCAQDDYCCSVFWDLTCAGEVETFACGTCS